MPVTTDLRAQIDADITSNIDSEQQIKRPLVEAANAIDAVLVTVNTDNLASLSNKAAALDNLGIPNAIQFFKALIGDEFPPSYTLSGLRAYVGSAFWGAYVSDTGYLFRYDPDDTTTTDNGTTCIVDGSGRRYKKTSLFNIIQNTNYL